MEYRNTGSYTIIFYKLMNTEYEIFNTNNHIGTKDPVKLQESERLERGVLWPDALFEC